MVVDGGGGCGLVVGGDNKYNCGKGLHSHGF